MQRMNRHFLVVEPVAGNLTALPKKINPSSPAASIPCAIFGKPLGKISGWRRRCIVMLGWK